MKIFDKNNFKLKISIIFLGSVIFSFLIFSDFRSNVFDSISTIYTALLVDMTNKNRASANISELKVNTLLEKAAQMKADDMASKSYFSHNTPEGKTPWYWLERVGYKYIYAGENLAVNFENSEQVERAWMNSKGHFLNIMNPKFTEIGIATSTGVYKGKTAIFVVQMFGHPTK